MSEDKDTRLVEVARAVLDGEVVDWRTTDATGEDSGTLQRLHQLETVATAYRFARESADLEQEQSRPTDEAVPSLQVLFTWGHLEVLQKLGEGAFGEVYRAFDPVLERQVALKLRRAERQDGVVGRRAILDEARKLARVRHPNVLTVYGADIHDGRVGLWTDLIAGQTLEERLKQDGPLSAHEATLIGIELCDALAALHAQGLIHGDVKAANIMRERGGRLVLLDFGAVSEVPDCSAGGGVTLGTPLVMAPEVLRGETPSVTADLYSLGVLLYHLTSGRYPIEAESIQQLCEEHSRGELTPLGDRRPDLPIPFIEITTRALQPSPDARFPSAGSMRLALARAMGQAQPAGLRDQRLVDEHAITATVPAPRAFPRRILFAIAATVTLAALLTWAVKNLIGPDKTNDLTTSVSGLQIAASLYREKSNQAEPVLSGSMVVPGDRLFLELESGESVHVYVLNEDDQGKRYVLFPLPGLDSTNPLPAGVRHRLPGRRSGIPQAWEVSSAGGREVFLVVAARQPLPDLERELQTFEAADPARQPQAKSPAGEDTRLRGIGGLTNSTANSVNKKRFLSELAARLAIQQSDGKVWLQQLELSNPGG